MVGSVCLSSQSAQSVGAKSSRHSDIWKKSANQLRLVYHDSQGFIHPFGGCLAFLPLSVVTYLT